MLFKKSQFFLIALFFLVGFFTRNLPSYAATFEDEVVSLINAERQKQNLTPLNYSSKLYQASYDHNNTMFTCAKSYGVTSCFKHQVTLLSEPTLLSRIQETGYNPQSVAENIAWGYTSPSSVVAGWMGSSGHKANILGSYKDIGCDYLDALNGSYKGMYWTCVFGKSYTTTTSTPTSTPTPTVSVTTPTPSPTGQVSLTPTKAPTIATPTPTQSLSKPWWCAYAPTHYMCR